MSAPSLAVSDSPFARHVAERPPADSRRFPHVVERRAGSWTLQGVEPMACGPPEARLLRRRARHRLDRRRRGAPVRHRASPPRCPGREGRGGGELRDAARRPVERPPPWVAAPGCPPTCCTTTCRGSCSSPWSRSRPPLPATGAGRRRVEAMTASQRAREAPTGPARSAAPPRTRCAGEPATGPTRRGACGAERV